MSTSSHLLGLDQGLAERYPREATLEDGIEATITPMVPSDWKLLERFLAAIQDQDRRFLRHDLTDPARVERWCSHLDYEHTLPLLAWQQDQIIANATLHRAPGLWTAHLAHVRLLVHPKYRGKGLGHLMLEELLAMARCYGLHKACAECAAEQRPLIRLLEKCGFHEAARLPEFIRDRNGQHHDMLLMVHDVG